MTYPTIMPALTLDFQNSQQLDPRVTFSRSSGATYINSAGQVAYAADHEARFDHDPVTGKCLGLLIEESRANIFDQSEDIATWTSNLWTKTNNVAISPDGTQTAGSLVPNVGTTSQSSGRTVTQSAGNYTCSVFAKPNGLTNLKLRFSGSSYQAIFDLTGDGSIISENNGEGKILKYPNGWYKCIFTINDTIGETAAWQIGTNEFSNVDGTNGFYIWGMQVEAGSFPTSYIPTAGSTVTRSADVAQVTGDNFSSWYNQSEATIVSTQIDADSGTGFGVVWGFGTGGGNRIELRQRSQEFRRGFYINGPSGGNISVAPLVFTKTSHAQQYTVGVAINASGADYAAEGVGVAGNTFTNATMPVIGTLHLSLGTQVDIASKTIARLSYYNQRITDAELQTITS